MNYKKTAADILRDKLTTTNLNKNVENADYDDLNSTGGIEYLKNDIMSKLYNPLFYREKYNDFGFLIPKTVLIYGISGVGKNHIIKAFSKQYKVPIISKLIETAADIRDLFRKGGLAEKSIILIKDFEVFNENKSLLIQLKESISSFRTNSIVVFINKDTNIPLNYDNEIFIKIPNMIQRKEIIEKIINKMKFFDIDTEKLSNLTPGFVPAQIKKLFNMATTKSISRVNSSGLIMDDFLESIKDYKNIQLPITFDDIGAMEKVKEELKNSIFLPSKYPEKFQRFGITRPSGILLYGPPGCGKTLIAKAVSNMSHCNFLSIKGPELITKYVGDSEKHLRDLFEKAKNLSPCVLFFDEIDSLCGKRGKNEFGNRIVNQILTLLDGIEDRGEVYLIGATNRINHIDKALLRPGRFDKIIEVPLPSLSEGKEIFLKNISKMPIENFDFDTLNLSGFSGAEISGIVKEAAILSLRDNFNNENLIIEKKYFDISIEKYQKMRLNRKN